MKVAVCSDLHLEFGDLVLKNEEKADVLILSGDILIASEFEFFQADGEDFSRAEKQARIYYNFLKNCCNEFPKVVMVMGNHEHYHGDFKYSFDFIDRVTEEFPNFVLFDKDFMVIDGYIFFGGTLWTDMNREDPTTMAYMASAMNDYRLTVNSNRMVSFNTQEGETRQRPSKLQVIDTVEDHKKFLASLDITLEASGDLPVIVVGHHAPSKKSTHPRYASDVMMNGAYSSNLDEFIMARPKIKLWTHGHTHEDFDYMIGSTRVVCNPRGYHNYEDRAANFKLKYVEV